MIYLLYHLLYKYYQTGVKKTENLVKEGYVLVVLVCLSDHLSVSRITYKVMNGFAYMQETFIRGVYRTKKQSIQFWR